MATPEKASSEAPRSSLLRRLERTSAAYVAFFLSGASSLIFQTIWTRMLHHVFGAAPVAISTVLTVFMAGLGLGAWIGGKIAHRIKHPIITYAVAEIGVGLWGLVIPLLVQSDGWLATVNSFLRAEFGAESGMFMVARFLCVAPILIIPTTLMGSTLPLLTRHFVSVKHQAREAGAKVGVLYAINTFGAATGPLLSAFFLMPTFGLTVTNIVACSMNFTLAAVIWVTRGSLLEGVWKKGEPLQFWPRKEGEPEEPSAAEAGVGAAEDEPEAADEPDEAKPDEARAAADASDAEDPPADEAPKPAPSGKRRKKKKKKRRPAASGVSLDDRPAVAARSARTKKPRSTPYREPAKTSPSEVDPDAELPIPELARKAAYLCFAASGAASLCYEVVWSRALAMTIGSSIYSFALILVTFLVGIAGGSAAMSAFLGKSARPYLGVGATSIGLIVLANVPWAVDMVDPTDTSIRLAGNPATYAGLCAIYIAPVVLALIWVWQRVRKSSLESKLFGDALSTWRPLIVVLMAAVPVAAAGVNSMRFPGHLPQIILSVVVAVATFVVVASLLSRAPALLVAIIQLFIAGATVVSYIWQDEIPYAFAQLVVGIPQATLPDHVGTVNVFMWLTIVLCMLPATLGMGAMFPLAVRVWTSGGENIARDVSVVYTGNTLGSIIGAWLPGFILFALVGAERTLHIGILLNMLLALGMLIAGASDPHEDQRWWSWRRLGAIALPVVAIGFFIGAMALSTPVVLASLFGGELPSALDARAIRALIGVPLLLLAIPQYRYLMGRSRRPPGNLETNDHVAVALPLLLGALLPWLLGAADTDPWAAKAMLWTVRVLVFGVGAFVAYANYREARGTDDAPPPAPRTEASDGGLQLPTWHAVTVYILSPLIPALLALLWLGTRDVDSELRWNRTQMTLGVFRVSLAQGMLNPDSWGAPDLLYYNDGLTTTVSVERWGRHYALKNNGKVDASNGDDMATQINVAAYPLLMHPSGTQDLDVAIVGFGSGVTVGSTLQFPVRRVDVIELERSIPEAARYFEDVNQLDYRLPQWPYVEMDRLTIINDDGRNYLASTQQMYDVIISEPSNPWITGVSDLFTVDHWRITKQRLREGGIYCQWVQLYELSPENIKTIYRTFASQFEHVVVLSADQRSSDTVMLGSDSPIRLDLERVQAAYEIPGVAAELERANLFTAYDIFARTLLASRDEVMAYTMIEERRRGSEWETDAGSTNAGDCNEPTCRRRAAILNTDDNARIEFSAPRDLIGFSRYEGYLETIYSQDWPYGNPLNAEVSEGVSVLTNIGEGETGARNYAELAMSMIAHGRYMWAGELLERSREQGEVREAVVAANVLIHLRTSAHEPPVRIDPPIPGPDLDADTARRLVDGFDQVRASIDEDAYGAAYNAMENIPQPLRRHSGPGLRFLWGYLLYKAADGDLTAYSAAVEELEDLVRTEEEYVLRHPEVYYFLARAREIIGQHAQALRAMRAYIEANLVPIDNDAAEVPEPEAGQATSTNAEGESDKGEHDDRG